MVTRPKSIRAFDQLYGASFALWALQKLGSGSATIAAMSTNPVVVARPELAGSLRAFVFVTTLVVTIISVLLWWGVARRGSVAAKWLVVVSEAIGLWFLISVLTHVGQGVQAAGAGFALGIAATLLAVAAAAMLFRPDAKAWFGQTARQTEPMA